MPVLSLACHLPHNTPNIPSRYNNEQTTKQTKAINNSYIYISHVNVTQTVPDISPLMPMHQDPLLVEYIDHRIELAYAQHRSQCVASGAIKSAHSNKHNNDNFHIQTRWQVYETEIDMKVTLTRTRWRRVKTLGQHQVGVNLQSHAQHQLWISTWHIFHEFHKIMPSLSYPVSLVNQNVMLVNISHWRLHMAWIMSLMST